MSRQTILELVIEIALFLIASYFIFYQSWLKSLGNELAKLTTVKDLTKLTEEVKKDFNESIESYKSKLNQELSSKIEPLKAELNKQTISHQIQYSYLHNERAKVIIELYKKLQELYSAMSEWTSPIQPVIKNADDERQERAERANKAFIEFKNYYLYNKIFFTKAFCLSIDDLIKDYWDKSWDFGYTQKQILEGNMPREYFVKLSKELSAISKEMREKIPLKILEIEDSFRSILYVEDK